MPDYCSCIPCNLCAVFVCKQKCVCFLIVRLLTGKVSLMGAVGGKVKENTSNFLPVSKRHTLRENDRLRVCFPSGGKNNEEQEFLHTRVVN